jgi:hypothetical protein
VKKISKATREAALEECITMSDDRRMGGMERDTAGPLAWAAWTAADGAKRMGDQSIFDECADLWLEAAALLRGDDEHEPWSPGSPVYLLSKETP